MEVKMKKIFTIYALLSILFFVAGCSGSKKETINDSDAVPDDDIETSDPENDPADDDIVPDEDEKSDEEADEEDGTDDFSLIQECFGKKVLTNNLAGWGLQDSTAIDLLPSNRNLLRSVYDTENSTRSRLQQQENEFTVALRWNKTDRFPVDVTLSLPVYAQHERLDYERGAIDTLARHNLFTVNPSPTP